MIASTVSFVESIGMFLSEDKARGPIQLVKNEIIACIPAYNEEKTIANVVLKTQKYVDRVIVCDDGSRDATAQIVQKCSVNLLIHKKNMGKGAALQTLFNYAKKFEPTMVITLDADGQHDPDELPRFIEPIIQKGVDVVIGSRYISGSWNDAPMYRLIGLKIINALVFKGLVKDTQNGYRAYSMRALDVIMQCKTRGYGIETEQIVRLMENHFKILEVPITARYKGLPSTSKKNPIRHGFELVIITLKLRAQYYLARLRNYLGSL